MTNSTNTKLDEAVGITNPCSWNFAPQISSSKLEKKLDQNHAIFALNDTTFHHQTWPFLGQPYGKYMQIFVIKLFKYELPETKMQNAVMQLNKLKKSLKNDTIRPYKFDYLGYRFWNKKFGGEDVNFWGEGIFSKRHKWVKILMGRDFF